MNLMQRRAPEIKTWTDPNTGKVRQYVALFDGSGLRLPIKRVIIGPGDKQNQRADRVRSLLGDVPITISRCP